MLKRTVIIGDASIINDFKTLCKKQGRIPSKLILSWMITFIQNNKIESQKHGRKKA